MSRKPLFGLGISVIVLMLLGGLYTNCQPLGESFIEQASQGPINDNEIPTDGSPLTKGQDLWVNSVQPALKQVDGNGIAISCNRCHNIPFEVMRAGGIVAPLTVDNYAFMKNLASTGPTSSNNPLTQKMKNLIAHGGGDMCPGDINGSVSPCREVSEWILAEFPLLTDGKAGELKGVSLEGRLTGWVADPLNINVPVEAFFYLNGPVGVGVLAGSQLANMQGIDVNGKHFNLLLDDQYRDGVERDVYIYADSAIADNLIPFMPEKHQGFLQKPLGDPARNIYENELRPRLNQCMGCHQVDYAVHWFQVGNPTPLNGGTPTNNELIDYMNGQNNHRGGSFCGGNKNNEPCASVQRWWAAEFGP